MAMKHLKFTAIRKLDTRCNDQWSSIPLSLEISPFCTILSGWDGHLVPFSWVFLIYNSIFWHFARQFQSSTSHCYSIPASHCYLITDRYLIRHRKHRRLTWWWEAANFFLFSPYGFNQENGQLVVGKRIQVPSKPYSSHFRLTFSLLSGLDYVLPLRGQVGVMLFWQHLCSCQFLFHVPICVLWLHLRTDKHGSLWGRSGVGKLTLDYWKCQTIVPQMFFQYDFEREREIPVETPIYLFRIYELALRS